MVNNQQEKYIVCIIKNRQPIKKKIILFTSLLSEVIIIGRHKNFCRIVM